MSSSSGKSETIFAFLSQVGNIDISFSSIGIELAACNLTEQLRREAAPELRSASFEQT